MPGWKVKMIKTQWYQTRLLPWLALLFVLGRVDAADDVELLHSFPSGTVTLEQVVGMQFDSRGTLYVLDGKGASLARVQQDSLEVAVANIAQSAGLDGRHQISAFSLLENDDFAVADARSGGVWLLNAKGEKQAGFGEKGRKAGMINMPAAMAYSINQRLYIADAGNSEISVYSPSGIYLYGLGQAESDKLLRLVKPQTIAVDSMEQAYALQAGKSPVISIYEPSGKLLKRLAGEELKSILGAKINLTTMTVDRQGRMYIADSSNGKIIQFNWNENRIEHSFGSKGKGPGQFLEVTALAIADDNRLAVLDKKNKKLDLYQIPQLENASEQRAWLANIGRAEFHPLQCKIAYQLYDLKVLCLDSKAKQVNIVTAEGKISKSLKAQFKSPERAAYDDKHIVILDKNHVFVFDVNGKYLTEFGNSGSKDGEIRGAKDIYIRKNRIYVADTSNRRVQVFSLKGVFLDKLPKAQDKKNPILESPAAVAVDANGKIYVADDKRKRILVFSDQNELIYEIGEAEVVPSAFKQLTDLALDTDNNLYVLTQTNLKEQTVQVYSGPEKVFEFGGFSKHVITGIGKGLTLSVSPTSKTIVGVFDVIDAKNPGMIAFNYLQVPPPVSELEIAGGEAITELKWQRPPGAYIKQFHVYGSQQQDGDYQKLLSTEQSSTKLEHKENDVHLFYKVSAVNGFGTVGPLSAERQNKFLVAQQLVAKEDIPQAVKILQEDLQRNPNQARAIKFLAQLQQRQENYVEAVELYRQLREYPEFAVEGLNLQVEALYQNKQYTEAMDLAQAAVKLAKDDIASYINCGRLSLKIGDAIGAFVCLENGRKLNADNIELIFLMAQAYIQLDTVDEGLALLEQVLETDPSEPELWLRTADIYYDLQRYELAQKYYSKTLALDEQSTKAKLGLARSYMALENFDQAKAIALQLAGNPETDSAGNYLLGLLALQDDNPAMAVIAFGKTTRAESKNADAWLALADAYGALKKTDEELKSLRSAVDADPASFAALKRLGLRLRDTGDYSVAADLLQQAVAINENDFDVLIAAAESFFNDTQYLRAAELSQQAVAIATENIDALRLAAKVAQQRGKIGEAIEYLKSAIALEKDDYALHVQLGELYLDNNLYEQGQTVLERATVIDKSGDRAFFLLGEMYLARRLFDKAISAHEQAVKNNSNPDNRLALDTAYAEKKRSLEFSSNAPQLVLEDLQLAPVFSAAYKQYSDNSVGSIKVRNVSGVEYGNLQVSFEIKGYMDFPTSQTVAKLEPNSAREVPLFAAFNNRILEIDEDTGVQVEVKLTFVREGRNDDISVTRSMTIYGKNAIVWNNANMIGSFVTPKDDTLRDFVRQAVNEFKPDAGPLSENLVAAMTLFNAFSAHGIRYEVDPNNPYGNLKQDQVDYVQFGRETLRLKSGDCDDLSVLFSAALENLGVETAIVDVPGHLLIIFNTNLPPEKAGQISQQDDLLVIRDNRVWVPLEVTMIATSFGEAWTEGAKKYYANMEQETLSIVSLKEAWQQYQPVTLKPAAYELKLPDTERVMPLVRREQLLLLQKSLDQQLGLYQAMLANNPDDHLARMQIAIIYAKNGLHALAIEVLDELTRRDANNSAVYNNRANIFFQQGDLQRAREAYAQAERLDPSDGGIKMNLALVAYKLGEIALARKKYKQALRLNDSLQAEYSTFDKLLKS